MFWIVAQSTSDMNIIQFLNICPSFLSIWRVTNTVASIWRKKYVSIFVFGHYLFFESHNCLLHQANYLRGQISLHVFMLNSTKCCLGVGLKVNSWPVFGGQSGQFPWILNGPSQNQVALDFLWIKIKNLSKRTMAFNGALIKRKELKKAMPPVMP